MRIKNKLLAQAWLGIGLYLAGCGQSAPPPGRAVVVPDDHATIIAVRLLFAIGPSELPAGTAALMAALLNNASSPLTDSTWQEMQTRGIGLIARAEREAFVIDLNCPRAEWEAMAPLLAHHLSARALESLRIDELRLEQHAAIEKMRHDPASLARAVFWSAIYPDGPGGMVAGGDRAIEAVTTAELGKFRTSFLTSGNLQWGLAGPVTAQMASQLEAALDETLPAGSRSSARPSPSHSKGLNVRIIELPEATKTLVTIGRALRHSCQDSAAWIVGAAAAQQAVPGLSRAGLDQYLRLERGLCEDLVFETGLVTAGTAGAEPRESELSVNDFILISAEFDPVNPLLATRIILKELNDLNGAGLPNAELLATTALLRKAHEGMSATGRMRALLAQRWLTAPPPPGTDDAGAFPLSAARSRQMIRDAYDPADLWVIFVTADARLLAKDLLAGTLTYQYPESVDRREMRRLDQEYFSYRPFWEAARVSFSRAGDFFQ